MAVLTFAATAAPHACGQALQCAPACSWMRGSMVRLVPLWHQHQHGATHCWNGPQRRDIDIDRGRRRRQRAILVCCHSQRPHHFSWLLPRKVLLGMFVCTFCALTKHLGSAPRCHARSFPDRKSCLGFWKQQLPGIACPEVLVCSRPRHQGLDADSYVSILAMP